MLSRLEHDELSVADALDRIEAITSVPERQREILETAERRGLVERDGARLRPAEGAGDGYVRFESEVVVRHGEFTCRRCGAAIGEGHFVRLDPGEVGPFGSSCVRTVLGRD
ncbi:MarR family transcriptional regulator [Halobacteriales archaeon SW_7_71_33]|nr:MAG: MarR family transcriptional regulator [Halobacteriales archaeon SW_7_71_33]